MADLVPQGLLKGVNSTSGNELEERRHEVVTFKPEELVPYTMPLRGKDIFVMNV